MLARAVGDTIGNLFGSNVAVEEHTSVCDGQAFFVHLLAIIYLQSDASSILACYQGWGA